MNLLEPPELDPVRQDIVIETTVILGALATGKSLSCDLYGLRLQLTIVGPITLRSLLNAGTSSKLLSLIKSLQSSNLPESQIVRILPSILRALRNVLVTTADLVWGHMWGVGAEKKVVGTGLVGEDVVAGARGKNSGKGRSWRVDATRALSLCFEVSRLTA